MTVIFSFLYALPLFFLVCLAAPVSQHTSQVVFVESEWTMTPESIVRDTIQDYFESRVDEVLSFQSEDLLSWLANTVSTHSIEKNLRPQATLLGLGAIRESCLAIMPSIIAKHIQQLNSHLYTTVEPAIDEYLSVLWPDYAQATASMSSQFNPHSSVVSILYSLNEAIRAQLAESMQNYELQDRVIQDMTQCIKHGANAKDVKMSMDKIMQFRSLHPHIPHKTTYSDKSEGFLDTHFKNVYEGLWFDMDKHVQTLYSNLQHDLNTSFGSS